MADDDSCLNLSHWKKACPGCGSQDLWKTCHLYYNTYKCTGCGGVIDTRVAMPNFVHVGGETPCQTPETT